MTMNKKLFTLVILFSSFFFFSNEVYATTLATARTTVACVNQTDQQSCDLYGKCKWLKDKGVCEEQSVAGQPCQENSIKLVLRFFGVLLLIARVVIPLIIIVIGSIDIFKAVVDKDEKLLSKQVRVIGIRILAGIFIFFIPTILHAFFKLSTQFDILNSSEYETCEECLLKPNECTTEELYEDYNG